MFKSIEELKSFQKQLRPSNENYIYYYLNTIYQFLLMREESPGADINEVNSKNLFSNKYGIILPYMKDNEMYDTILKDIYKNDYYIEEISKLTHFFLSIFQQILLLYHFLTIHIFISTKTTYTYSTSKKDNIENLTFYKYIEFLRNVNVL